MQAGTRVDGRYDLVERLDGGAFSESWLARDSSPGSRRVVLEFILPGNLERPEAMQQFGREVAALGALQHPHVVALIDRGLWEGRPYVLRDHAAGQSLARWLEARRNAPRRPDPTLVTTLSDQLCAGVRAAHDLRCPGPVVHRDLAPIHVIIHQPAGGEPVVKVQGFGIALLGAHRRTPDGGLPGHPAYQAPEQGLGQAHLVGPPTDVFSLAVLILEMLTGRADLGTGGPLWAWVLQHEASLEASLAAQRQDVPGAVWKVLARALRSQPAHRFGDAGLLRAALQVAWEDVASIGLLATLPVGQQAVLPPTRAMTAAPDLLGPAPPDVPPPPGPPAPPPAGLPVTVAIRSDAGPPPVAPGTGAALGAVPPAAPRPRRRRWLGCLGVLVLLLLAGGGVFVWAWATDRLPVELSCDLGDQAACVEVGEQCEQGQGLPVDLPRAIGLYREACDAGNGHACFNLAGLYERGGGVAPDHARAQALLAQACAAGYREACGRR